MTRMKYLVAAATLSLFLAGCSGSKEEVPDNPPNEIYATAQQKLQDGNWRQAITQLEALDNRYPFGPYSQQVQLDLIYAYYKNADLPLAQAAIDRFIRLNPTHPNIDYVMYMRGLILNMHELRLVTFPNWCAAIRTVSTPPMPPNVWYS